MKDFLKKFKGAGVVLALLLVLGQIPFALAATAPLEAPLALFETSLASQISTTATTMTLVSGTTKDGTTLNGTYSFTISEGNADQEFVRADCVNTACTGLERGISTVTGTTTIPALEYTHRRGTSVKITDAPILLNLARIINGIGNLPSPLSYSSLLSIASSSNQLVPASWVYNNFVNTSEVQTVNGAKTLTATTTANQGILTTTAYRCTSGSNVNQLCDKNYIDSQVIAGGTNGSETVKGVYELATAAEMSAGTSSGGTGARLVLPASQATSTSQVATSSIVITKTTGIIDSSFLLNGSYTFTAATTTNATTTNANITNLTVGACTGCGISTNTQTFTSSGTWTKPANAKYIVITVIGAGGSGGGGDASHTSGGGGGGALNAQIINASTATSSVNVIVGLGGTGQGFNSDGNTGGTSSFGTYLTASGGGPGRTFTNGQTGGAGGTVGGTFSTGGVSGGVGASGSGTAVGGGACAAGTATATAGTNDSNCGAGSTSGVAGSNYGGGSGGATANNSSAAGAPGIVVVVTYS